MTKKILGLDLGTNSIGWALIEQDFENKQGKILGMGSRIIPMSQDILGKFGAGQSHSQTAERTQKRSARKLYQRDNLRRERLHRVLNILDFLPQHYKAEIDFISHKGQFINYAEPKLPWFKNKIGKYEFLFRESFDEMVNLFKEHHPELFAKGKKIPFDWTIYYLRTKALTQKISKEELAWILLNFNQKRGYYQLSEEDENSEEKPREFVVLKVKQVIDSGEQVKGNKLYDIIFENDWKYDKQTTKPSDWENKTKEFIVTESTNKNGEIKRTFKAVSSEEDWIAIKKKSEQDIEKSNLTVGAFIFNTLIKNPTQKIRGKLIRTIERKYYKKELSLILEKQLKEHPELQNKDLYKASISDLYPSNETHRRNIENRGFQYLFSEDIIFFQRPLKSKVHLISDCSLESRVRKDNKEVIPVKCIAKSNPLFQEFRLWQFISNLKIIEKEKDISGKTEFDVTVTEIYLPNEGKWVDLFDWLNDRESVSQKQLLSFLKLKEDKFRWNYVEDKEYPCNETRAKLLTRLKRIKEFDKSVFNSDNTKHLWHILYSVTDPDQRKKAIRRFAQKHNQNEQFVESFASFPAYKREYGAFSEKAIKKLLPLMRRGKYWSENGIYGQTRTRINSIITRLESINYEIDKIESIADDDLPVQIIKSFIKSGYILKGLNTFQASYLVYGRHSEASDTGRWETSSEIAHFLKHSFKQHSLRNPIVEQVLTETLRIVKDIWDEYGNGVKNFFNEIHIELGREMKNDKKTRERISKQVADNENTNQRIRSLLTELKNEGLDVRPYSPTQQEILKIYEEGVYSNEARKEELEEADKIRKIGSPTKAEIQRYKLWLEQGYISPYTGKTIMLSELFTHKFQIEHIFPQSRYFDDSLSNKIICEAEVNQLKDNLTAYEFITQFGGHTLDINGQNIKILSLADYEKHIKNYFTKTKTKRDNLLRLDIPESFINRQMNDSRYISKVVKNLLSKIVRDESEKEVTSKYIVPITGAITSQMKTDWGLNDVWNDIITPRFERMNELTKSKDFGEINSNTNKFLPKVPETLLRGFTKKRVDHRHHALDALVIACTTRDHVNYITSINTERKNYSLVSKLRKIEEIEKATKQTDGKQIVEKRKVAKDFYKPWVSFTQDVRSNLETTIVSFKQNTRIINKTKNKYQKILKGEDGTSKKLLVSQTKGENWAIRKPLHKDTVYGKVMLTREGKTFEATARRVELSNKFTRKHLESITDSGIQSILENHVKKFIDDKGKEQFDLAFSPEGIEELNKNMTSLNGGKFHQPIRNVRIYEVGSRFSVGTKGNKGQKYVESAKGTNLFFAIYKGNNKKGEAIRQYSTIPLNEVVESLKQGGKPAPNKYYDKDKNEYALLFTLSPNDLVYIPTSEEQNNPQLVDFSNLTKEQINRIYKMEKASGIECYFIRNDIASLIKQYDPKSKLGELSSQNKLETTMELESSTRIKELCWKLETNRLGKVKKVIK